MREWSTRFILCSNRVSNFMHSSVVPTCVAHRSAAFLAIYLQVHGYGTTVYRNKRRYDHNDAYLLVPNLLRNLILDEPRVKLSDPICLRHVHITQRRELQHLHRVSTWNLTDILAGVSRIGHHETLEHLR